MYINSIPNWVQKLFKKYLWQMPSNDFRPTIYLTFDDGPHPEITDWILEQLQEYNAKASFFCIGKNVVEYPNVYQRILDAGHNVGNHTHNHLKGRTTKNEVYINDVKRAQQYIQSKLFRPPYGSLGLKQSKIIQEMGFKVVLWSLIPGDWDSKVSPEACLENVVFNLNPGDIIVLHDSDKAKTNMQYVLPRLLEHCKNKGWAVDAIPE